MKNSNSKKSNNMFWSFVAGIATTAIGAAIADEVCSRRARAKRIINRFYHPLYIGVNNKIYEGAEPELHKQEKLFIDGVITTDEFIRRVNTINQNIIASVAKYDAMEDGWQHCKYEEIFKYDYFERR